MIVLPAESLGRKQNRGQPQQEDIYHVQQSRQESELGTLSVQGSR